MNVWLVSSGVFLGSALLTLVVLSIVSAGHWRVGRRLKTMHQHNTPLAAPPSRADEGNRFPPFAILLGRTGQYTPLARMLARAGLNWRPDEYVAAWGGVGLLLGGFGGWLWGVPGLCGGILLTLMGSGLVPAGLQQARRRQFEQQLPDALMLMASALRTGYGILRALQAIRDETKPPIALEFAKVLEETAVGQSVPEALGHLVQRMPLPDLEIAVTAIQIHLDIGGNLAEILETVANTLRERQRIRGEVEVLTAEGRLSGLILFLLPIVMAFVLSALNPTYMQVLFNSPFGHVLLVCAGILQVIGGIVIIRMLEVDF